MTASLISAMGYVAGLCTTVSLIPQVMRIVKLRTARDVSVVMYLLFTLGTLLWMAYGIILHALPLTVWNAISFVLAATILGLKLRFDRNAKDEMLHR